MRTSVMKTSFNEKLENHRVFLKKLLGDLMKISGRFDVRGKRILFGRKSFDIIILFIIEQNCIKIGQY